MTMLMADITGIYKVDIMDHTDAEVMAFTDFLEALRTLDALETVYTAVDPDELEIIEEQYGVQP